MLEEDHKRGQPIKQCDKEHVGPTDDGFDSTDRVNVHADFPSRIDPCSKLGQYHNEVERQRHQRLIQWQTDVNLMRRELWQMRYALRCSLLTGGKSYTYQLRIVLNMVNSTHYTGESMTQQIVSQQALDVGPILV